VRFDVVRRSGASRALLPVAVPPSAFATQPPTWDIFLLSQGSQDVQDNRNPRHHAAREELDHANVDEGKKYAVQPGCGCRRQQRAARVVEALDNKWYWLCATGFKQERGERKQISHNFLRSIAFPPDASRLSLNTAARF